MSTNTPKSDKLNFTRVKAEDTAEPLPINNHVTVDLGIKQFKKLMKQRVADRNLPKKWFSDVIRDFKKRQWKVYHDVFPEDNSSHPTHKHLPIDKLALL